MSASQDNNSGGPSRQTLAASPAEPVVVTAPAPVAAPQPHGHPGEDDSHVPVHFRRGTGARIAVAAVVIGLVLAGIYVLGTRSRAASETALQQETEHTLGEPPRVNVATAQAASSTHQLSLPAECRPLLETTLYARVSGYLRQWHFDIGDKVRKGDVLCTIETPELDSQITEARARITAQQSEIKLAEAAANFAKVSLDRYKSAAPDGAVSQQELDQKQSEYEVAFAKLQAARATLNLHQAALQSLESMARFKNVVAPFDGIITARYIDIGALITAGSTTSTTPLFRLARFDTLRVNVAVPQAASAEIKPGLPATVAAAEFPGQQFPGKVDRTSQSIEPRSGTLDVEILVANPDLKLLPGMYVSANLQVTRHKPAVRVPASAVVFRADGPCVVVVGKRSHLHFRRVQIARDLGDAIELASGVSNEDRVVLNIRNDVSDGQLVRVADEHAAGVKPVATAAATHAASTQAVVQGK